MGIIESVKLIYVDVSGNNNKTWQAQLHDTGDVVVQWGRVGSKLQEVTHAAAGRSRFETLRREKLRKGYEVARTVDQNVSSLPSASLKQIAMSEICGQDTTDDVKALIEHLSEANIHSILDSTTLTYTGGGNFVSPLGVLTPDAVYQARLLLGQLAAAHQGARPALLNNYLRLVPQRLPAKIDHNLFVEADDLQKQRDLLDALDAVMPTLTTSTRVFDCRILRVPHTTEEGRATFKSIRTFYEASANTAHTSAAYKLRRVWEVTIPTMAGAFESGLGNVQRLWHGTRAANLLSILKHGLLIPPASAGHCTGRRFGDGLYFSNQSTKSLYYASGSCNHSRPANPRTFMFLTDVALGREHRPRIEMSTAPRGFDSLWIEPGSCGSRNHEAIVYRTSQVNLRYLCEFA